MKLAVVRLSGSMASLKLAVTAVLSATAVAPLAGKTVLTIGGVVSGAAPVVKLQVNGTASGLPATSLAAVVMVAVHVVLEGSGLPGVKLATLPLVAYATVPPMLAPEGQASVKLAVVRLAGFIASLKLAVTAVLIATVVAPLAGKTELTVGAVVSGAALVVKLDVKGAASVLPATSRAAVLSITVQLVLDGSALPGVKLALLLLIAVPTVPVMAVPAGQASVRLLPVRLSGSMASLKLRVTALLIAMPVAPAAGSTAVTVGRVVSAAALVVKLQLKGAASALPAVSRAAVVMLAAQLVLAGRALLGVKVATLPLIA